MYRDMMFENASGTLDFLKILVSLTIFRGGGSKTGKREIEYLGSIETIS
jgi:hypothetical protein